MAAAAEQELERERLRQEQEQLDEAEAQAAAALAAEQEQQREREAELVEQLRNASLLEAAAVGLHDAAQSAALPTSQSESAAAESEPLKTTQNPIGSRGAQGARTIGMTRWRKETDQPSPTHNSFSPTAGHDFQHPHQPSSVADLPVQQASVTALYSADDPVILPQHLKDQTSQYDAPQIHFGFSGLRKPVDQPAVSTAAFTASLVG